MEARLRPLREVHRTLRQRRAARGGVVRLPALFTVRCEKIQEQVDVAALCSDEHGIALEGKHTDLEQWRPDLVKRVEEVACVNKLLERERRAESVVKPTIFGTYTAAPLRPLFE